MLSEKNENCFGTLGLNIITTHSITTQLIVYYFSFFHNGKKNVFRRGSIACVTVGIRQWCLIYWRVGVMNKIYNIEVVAEKKLIIIRIIFSRDNYNVLCGSKIQKIARKFSLLYDLKVNARTLLGIILYGFKLENYFSQTFTL